MPITVGLKGRTDTIVTPENTANAVGSGLVPVFATPFMVALMEKACADVLIPHLNEGEGSVGTLVNISHASATPIGMKVWAESELTSISGKLFNFTVSAYDEAGLIGTGTHQRCLINVERFLAKTEQKRKG